MRVVISGKRVSIGPFEMLFASIKLRMYPRTWRDAIIRNLGHCGDTFASFDATKALVNNSPVINAFLELIQGAITPDYPFSWNIYIQTSISSWKS